ncbi:MAG: hypothetical protein V3U18_07910 [Alphaproteobacteria bacterium]
MKASAFAAMALTGALSVYAMPGFAGEEEKPLDSSRLSAANEALYTTNHLESITEPVTLIYDFERKGTLGEAFTDKVEERITKVLPSGRKNLSFRFLSGKHRVRFSPRYGFNGNPIFMLFLERDVRQLQRLTGGSALYFRTRIRDALAGSAETNPTTFSFNGETFSGIEIRIQPFANAELKKRFPRLARKIYVFVLSDKIPGGFYRISSLTPVRKGDSMTSDETVTFREIVTADEKRKK